jgi:hypothetical protein
MNMDGGGSTGNLATLIPGPLWKHCKAAALHAGATEAASCSFPDSVGGAQQANFLLFPSTHLLDAHYKHHLAVDGKVGQGQGACNGIEWGGEDVWNHGPGEPGGRRFCYFKGNSSYIIWTVSDVRVLATASREDRQHPLLYNWWRFWHHRVQ